MRSGRKRQNENLHRRGREGLGRSERIRMKLLICALGLLLLALLVAGQTLLRPRKPHETPSLPYVTITMELRNVWIMEVGEDDLLLYRDGREERYCYAAVETERETEQGAEKVRQIYQPDRACREQVADVTLENGCVADVRVKREKIHGTVLGAGEKAVEVEGFGVLPLADDFKGYRVYHTLAMCTQRDLVFGYDFADFVMENGEICAVLMVREEAMRDIRVLIRTSDYEDRLHQEITLTCDTDYRLRYGAPDAPAEELHTAGEEVTIAADSAYFEQGRVWVEPAALSGHIFLRNVARSQKAPAYRGYMELVAAEGGFAVVNTVSLEEYLYAVVPSEMPASYPSEALKAQAVCARTYAYGHMLHAAYPAYGAHLDDSSAYQVYHNISEQEKTTAAVKATYGKLLYTEQEQPAETFYYSTSCGVGSDPNVWKTEAAKAITYMNAKAINPSSLLESNDIPLGEYLREEEHFRAFITTVNPDDYESGDGWYRWTYHAKNFDVAHFCELLQKRWQAAGRHIQTLVDGEYVSQEIPNFTKVYDMYIASRGAGGVAEALVVETDEGIYQVVTEHNIRYVLCDGQAKIRRQNGNEVSTPTLLPSGFFVVDTGKEDGSVVEYTLIGGGFGHGVGMSQNAAKEMAAAGLSGEDILLFFYDGCTLKTIYENEEQ